MVFEKNTHTIEQREQAKKEPAWVNKGEPPMAGRLKKRSRERKETCEDVKLNDPETGLFLVGDGVSDVAGWFASRELAQQVQEELGASLDEQIEHLVQVNHKTTEEKGKLIDQLVQSAMAQCLYDSDQAISVKAQMDPNINESVTTATLAKLVEHADGKQYVYFTNVGDSRMYLLRGDRLLKLTMDDGYLTEAVNDKKLTLEEARAIDQAASINDLPDHHRHYFRFRHILTRSVGTGRLTDVVVRRMTVQPGDRLVLLSDGMTDQLLETQLKRLLMQTSEDREAEAVLQAAADEMTLAGTDPRAKADDISALVRTIGARGPSRGRMKKTSPQLVHQITPQDVERWRQQIPKLEIMIHEAKQEGRSTQELEQELLRNEYWVTRMSLESIERQYPPLLVPGAQVRVKRTDLTPPVIDRVAWEVKSYDPAMYQYLIERTQGSQSVRVDRFMLELWQPELVSTVEMKALYHKAIALKKQLNFAKKKLT